MTTEIILTTDLHVDLFGPTVEFLTGARNGWRNVSSEPLVLFIITPTRLAQFFQEVGRLVAGTPKAVAVFFR